MFNLKRKRPAIKQNVKKLKEKATGFATGSSSDEETDQETNFIASIKKKSEKVSIELQKHQNEEEVEHLIDSLDKTEKKPEQHTGSKYMKNLLENSRKRKQEQMISKYESLDKQFQAKGVEIFESEDYKREKEGAIRQKEEESDEESEHGGRNDALFYTKILNTKLGETSGILDRNDTERSNIEKVEQKEKVEKHEGPKSSTSYESFKLQQRPLHERRRTWHEPHIRETTSSSNDTMSKFEKLIREFVKSKITSTELQAYKDRYWERRHKDQVTFN